MAANNINADLSAIAALLGRRGGSVRSAAKAAAVRANGKKGGRPVRCPECGSKMEILTTAGSRRRECPECGSYYE